MNRKTLISAAALLLIAIVAFAFYYLPKKQLSKKVDADTSQPYFFKDSTKLVAIPNPTNYVNDFAQAFTLHEKQILDSIIIQHEKKTTNQIAIVTFDTIDIAKEKFEAYVLQLANKWGVGQKGKNNGVVIAFCLRMKKIRIEIGYGIEKLLPETVLQKIIDTEILPNFKQTNFYKGALNGTQEIVRVLEGGN